ncbi:hypothetical protein FO519_003670 [Halicephalobus sp. NKZ332]|nr:hypothetical protein FO519_003670 [Halicephalobus sp. NKZ332]
MVATSLTVFPTTTTKFGIMPDNETLIAVINEQFSQEDIGSEYLYVLPFIVIFGVCGNIISLVAILHSRLRRTAANQYLIVLTIADCVFLLGLTLIWTKFDFISYETCAFSEYILQSASYVSSWSISVLTIERYLAIAHPLKHMRYSHVNRYKLMLFWVPIPFILNIVQFFALIPADPSETDRGCVLDGGTLSAITEAADIIIGYLIPCFIVVVLNLLVASKVESADKGFMVQKDKDKEKGILIQKDKEKGILIKRDSGMATESVGDSRRQGRPNSASGGSTRILLVVPVVYILLNTPFYLCRLVDIIALNFFGNQDFSIQGGMNKGVAMIYNTSYYLYYINFASDVIVYAFSSANFRKTVVIAWKRILCPHLDPSGSKPDLSHAIISKSRKCSSPNIPVGTKLIRHKDVTVTRSFSPTSCQKPEAV